MDVYLSPHAFKPSARRRKSTRGLAPVATGVRLGGQIRGFEPDDDDAPIPDRLARNELGIPVFWKGNIEPDTAPGCQSFWLSLSRVMRVPFKYSVGDVAQHLY